MPDILDIGMKVESKQVKKAAGDLNEFTVSAKTANKQVEKLVRTSKKNEKSIRDETLELKKRAAQVALETAELKKQNAQIRQQKALRAAAIGQSRKVEKLATGQDTYTGKIARDLDVNRFNTSNIAAQFQDVAVTAAMGMNPMTVALQQGTQLSAVLNNMKNPIEGLKKAFTQLLNPVSLVTVAVVGLIAALVQIIDWGKLFDSMLEFLEKNIEKLTYAALALSAALAIANRDQITKWWVGTFLPAIKQALTKMKLMIPTTISLSACFSALGKVAAVAWGIITAPITWIIAGVALVIAAILKLTGAFDHMAKKFNEWRENMKKGDFWKETNASIEREIGALKLEARYVERSVVFREGMRKAMEYYNKALDKNIDLTDEEIDRLIKSGMEYAKIRQEMERREEFLQNKSDFIDSLNSENRALMFQTSLLGKNETEIEKLTHLEEMQNKAKEKGLLGDTEVEKLIQDNINLYNSYIDDKNALDKYNSKVNEAKSITNTFFTDMNHALIQGKSLWEAFGDSVMNVLSKILDKMTSIGIDQLFAAGKASNWFGFGSSSTVTTTNGVGKGVDFVNAGFTGPQALGGAWDRGVQKFATGGIVGSPTLFGARNGVGLMGEAGPEAIMPLTRGANGELGVKADGVGGSSVVVNVINNSNSKATVNQRQTQQGTEIDVVIDQLVADKLGTIGSASNTAMNTWNNRQLIAR